MTEKQERRDLIALVLGQALLWALVIACWSSNFVSVLTHPLHTVSGR